MKWETVTTEPCLLAATTENSECQTQADQDTENTGLYSDPVLIIKPAFAIVQEGETVQYSTFLLQNGVEQQINSGLDYSTNAGTIAQVGVASGSAVGLAEGIAAISVTWNGLYASAQLTVVESCADATAATALVVDCSPSMGQEMPGYNTKLAFAKLAALRLANELNVNKDSMMVGQFATDFTMLTPASVDKTYLANTINSLTVINSTGGTNLLTATLAAANAVKAVQSTTKVVVVITDGVCNELGQSTVPGLLAQIVATGVVVMVLGVRASGDGFNLLQLLASGGFIGNAYDLFSGQDALDMMSGLKGYLCAGNCNPTESYTINQGDADYDSFTNFDVVSGKVDLLGNGFLDFLPGNGLYVGLSGVGTEDGPLKHEWQWQAKFVSDPVGDVTNPFKLWPEIGFQTPKILDGLRVRTYLSQLPGGMETPITAHHAGPLLTFRVYGFNGGVWTLVKIITVSCSNESNQIKFIGPEAEFIFRLNNNTAYLGYQVRLESTCDGKPGVCMKSVDFYTKTTANVPTLGVIRTSAPLAVTIGQAFQLTVRLAGNQRFEAYDEKVHITVGPIGGPYSLDEIITVPWNQAFTDYAMALDATANENWYITIEQTLSTQPGSGIFLDSVLFERVAPTSATVFNYGFDGENPQTIDPPCPEGYESIYANCGGAGCLEMPPGAQEPDPNPLPKIE